MMNNRPDLLRISTAGSVDVGKSTLLGRLIYEGHGLYEDQLKDIRNDSNKLNRKGLDLSLIMDGLKAERQQNITIDVSYRYFSTHKRNFIIADSPGHEQYTRNMATGASTADLGIVLVDAKKGLLVQSKRHAFISSLIGIKNIVVAINKMDLVRYSEKIFNKIIGEFNNFASKLQFAHIEYIPISALNGDNVVKRSSNMPWYKGPSILSYIENLQITGTYNLIDLRFPVQCVLRPNMDFRGYAGTISSGVIHKEDEVMVLPSRRKTRINSIVSYDGEKEYAFAPQSVTVTIEDDIDISRGDIIVHPKNLPQIRREIEAILVWLDTECLEKGKVYWIKHTTQIFKCSVSHIDFSIDPNTLSRKNAHKLELNEIGRVTVQCFRSIFCDEYRKNRFTGSFILIDPITHATAAAGMIIERGKHLSMVRSHEKPTPETVALYRHESEISSTERENALKQKPVTIWLTGLSGSGKSSIAYEIEKRLMKEGHLCYVLDGDNVRYGLNRDLGFSPQDRCENIRRIAEVASLFNKAGIMSIVACISPYKQDRRQARQIIGEECFVEVFLSAPIEICEKRDPKGLYEKARQGLIEEFTGINAPYEAPANPEITLKTAEESLNSSASNMVEYLREMGFLG